MNIKKIIKLEFPAPFVIEVKNYNEFASLLKDIEHQTRIKWMPRIKGAKALSIRKGIPSDWLTSEDWEWNDRRNVFQIRKFIKFTYKFPRYYINFYTKSSIDYKETRYPFYKYQPIEYPSKLDLLEFLED